MIPILSFRVAVGDGSPAVRMKHHVYTVLANMGSAMPCITLWSSGLPRVTGKLTCFYSNVVVAEKYSICKWDYVLVIIKLTLNVLWCVFSLAS